MLSVFVGSVEFPAAMVLAVAIVCICVVISLLILRQSRAAVANNFTLAKLRLDKELEDGLEQRSRQKYAVETDRMVKLKQIESGLITSHTRES